MDLGLDGWVSVLIILELGGALGKFKGNEFTFTHSEFEISLKKRQASSWILLGDLA